ncbi:hypothetical protein RUM43_012322 [Polyplax serrata]|uniref:Uncharacterized protein n=1 Tax=Polyplax serrata TaxID=468196 RepID=A0AAN8NKH8_POLSC
MSAFQKRKGYGLPPWLDVEFCMCGNTRFYKNDKAHRTKKYQSLCLRGHTRCGSCKVAIYIAVVLKESTGKEERKKNKNNVEEDFWGSINAKLEDIQLRASFRTESWERERESEKCRTHHPVAWLYECRAVSGRREYSKPVRSRMQKEQNREVRRKYLTSG